VCYVNGGFRLSLMKEFMEKARSNPKKVVLPEGEEERVLKAAELAVQERIAFPTLLGAKKKIKNIALSVGITLDGIDVVEPTSSPDLRRYISLYCEMRGVSDGVARRILRRPVYFGAMMVRSGDRDGVVASRARDDIIVASELIIGMEKGVSTPSSFFLMDIPGYSGGEEGLLMFADCAVNPNPTPEQLADIAIASASSAKALFGWAPRIAMLSFSTKGSGDHPHVRKVVEATEIVKDRDPQLAVDGELQADAAIVLEVARRKIKGESPVAGRANILIFPDLDAGNIAYKLVQRLAKAAAYGPVLQGFAKPVSDLSRGATIDDILGAITLVVVRAQQRDS
jgi:phosphate acetyltransferase